MAASFEKTCIVTRADAIDLTDVRTEPLLALEALLAGEGVRFRRLREESLSAEPLFEESDGAGAPPAPGVRESPCGVAESAPDGAEPPFDAAVAATLEASCAAGAESEPQEESRRQMQAVPAAKAEFFIEALSKWVSHFIQNVVSYLIVHRVPPRASAFGQPCRRRFSLCVPHSVVSASAGCCGLLRSPAVSTSPTVEHSC